MLVAAAEIFSYLAPAASMGNACSSGQVRAITIGPTTSEKIMPFHLFSLPFTESFANLLLVSLKVNTFRITWILSRFYLRVQLSTMKWALLIVCNEHLGMANFENGDIIRQWNI